MEAGCFRYDAVALVGSSEVIPVRLASFAHGDSSRVVFLYFFGVDGLNIGQILRLTSFAQDD